MTTRWWSGKVKRWIAVGAAAWMWGAGCSSGPEAEADEEVAQAPQQGEIQQDNDLLPAAGSPMMGDPMAPITVVEFSSMQCPFSAQAMETIEALVEENSGDVRLVYKHFPLGGQHDAEWAVEAAGRQGDEAFWAMRRALFERSHAYGDQPMSELAAEVAQEIGLDVQAFREDFQDPEVAQRVEEDQQLGIQSGVQGTPLFSFNGVVVSGAQSLEYFQSLVDEQLEIVEALRQQGIAEHKLSAEAMAHNLEEARRGAQ